MARMRPDYTDEQIGQIPSAAERAIFRAARQQLGDQYLVLHGVEWIVRAPQGNARDGEADFVVCHPDLGVIVIEVKGGGIEHDPVGDKWYSVDRHKERHEISDPFRQAKIGKFSILTKLKEHSAWPFGASQILIGHAVLFPDIDDIRNLCMSQSPSDIIGGRAESGRIERWLRSVFDFWSRSDKPQCQLTKAGVDFIERVFARPVRVLPLLSSRLNDEEQDHIRLTEQQLRTLSLLGSRRRAAIAGGAGTGKTLLAMEKARRLASEGFQTLLVCFNRPLADYLSRVENKPDGLIIMSFHQLCGTWIDRVAKSSGRDLKAEAAASYPNANLHDVLLPAAMTYAIEVLPDRFDAVVVDEGQDFREEYWFPIELILKDTEQSPLYIFYDQNQDLYHRASTFPIKDDPFVLTVNCRNTRRIHEISYQFFRGEQTDPPGIPGIPVELLCAPTLSSQAKKIHSAITELLTHQKVSPNDIVVLVTNAIDKAACISLLTSQKLPHSTNWSVDGNQRLGKILMDTVNRFKGLESPIVVLWGLDGVEREPHRELLYVGLSRAKSLMYLAGHSDSCNKIILP